VIELKNVVKVFGRRTAVDDLTLSVPRGAIYGLLGHNGAGKSTAIGMMLGQVWPTHGEVRVGGHEVTSHRRLALQKVGAIFETPVFYDYLSGWRNLEILSHYTGPTTSARIREVLDLVGLNGRETSRVRTYSHGMRTRLALAQALLPNPELLILDEPGDGLDPEGIHELRLTILRLNRELGLTILLSSHLLNEVEQLCTCIAMLNQGRKVFEGPLLNIRTKRRWLRLRTGDFAAATRSLSVAGLITGDREGRLIELAPEAVADHIVRHLVGQGMPVFEITPEEQSLENFYLSLMKDSREQPAPKI
jgi:ABC-2 type transport system ATP-binding protein